MTLTSRYCVFDLMIPFASGKGKVSVYPKAANRMFSYLK